MTPARTTLSAADFDDLLGGSSPLDRALSVTVFADAKARKQERRTRSLRTLALEVHAPIKPVKADLPCLNSRDLAMLQLRQAAFARMTIWRQSTG